MDMLGVLKLLHVFLLATVKFFVTFPYALLIGIKQEQAVLIVTLGGVLGFIFFYFISGMVIHKLGDLKNLIRKMLPDFLFVRLQKLNNHLKKWKESKLTFSKKNRFLVHLRGKYGLLGIVIATPIILSIPIGAFLLNKYYSRHRHAFKYMIVSIVGWAILFSTIIVVFPKPI